MSDDGAQWVLKEMAARDGTGSCCGGKSGSILWYSDREALRLIGLRYLPLLAGLNLAWEIAHLSLYTLWHEGSPAFIVFSVAHCTLGDVAIGVAALLLALIATRAAGVRQWRFVRIAVVTALVGTVYTIFSEWMNTATPQGWAYSALMPVLPLFGTEIGLSPIAQWLILPLLALRLALTFSAVSGGRL